MPEASYIDFYEIWASYRQLERELAQAQVMEWGIVDYASSCNAGRTLPKDEGYTQEICGLRRSAPEYSRLYLQSRRTPLQSVSLWLLLSVSRN
jgi:hypothetical protein